MKTPTYKVAKRGNQYALVKMVYKENSSNGTTVCYYFSREHAQEMADHLNLYPDSISEILHYQN